jgi:ArsR family transcriptional regulator, arsenate/arsenite/antimonite-responsive transcriptional repressor
MPESTSDALCCPPMTGAVLDEDQAVNLAHRLKALSDPVRLRLVSLLACSPSGEVCACDLPLLLGRKQPTVSHHLKLLTEAGILDREQRGKWAWFRLVPGALDQIRAALGHDGASQGAAPDPAPGLAPSADRRPGEIRV